MRTGEVEGERSSNSFRFVEGSHPPRAILGVEARAEWVWREPLRLVRVIYDGIKVIDCDININS